MTFWKKVVSLSMACTAYVQMHVCKVLGAPRVCDKKARPISPMLAEAIMGRNFIGFSAMSKLGIAGTSSDSDAIWIDEEYLRARRDTHVLVAMPSCSVNDLQAVTSHKWGINLLSRSTWLQGRLFARRRGRLVEWHLVPKYPVGNELAHLDARVLVYTALAYLVTNKQKYDVLFVGKSIPCNDVDVDGCRICVTFLWSGISVNRCRDGQGDSIECVPAEFTQVN